nr:MAG TPA_asm: hypothetical protein [Caudoviricetes sp.]
MSLNREKRGHYNQLRAASHQEADLALLESIDPKNELLVKPSGKEQKYADNVLYELLTLTSNTEIIAFRRKFAKEKLQKSQREILQKRFAEYIKKADPKKTIDIQEFIKIISAGLFLLVATLDWPIDEDVFPSEIELVAVDNEKYHVKLTTEAITARQNAKKAKEEAVKTNLSEELQEKQSELEEKEDELLSKESDLDDKETELSEKEDLLSEKEAELAVKEADLNNKATVEKKSVSKKKNTRK